MKRCVCCKNYELPLTNALIGVEDSVCRPCQAFLSTGREFPEHEARHTGATLYGEEARDTTGRVGDAGPDPVSP